MNQAILFTDNVDFDATTNSVVFYAQVSGLLVNCRYESQFKKEEALAKFVAARFDYEDIAENAIEDERFDQNGEIILEEL